MQVMQLKQEAHADSLERLSAAALSAGDYVSAFMYADRRCRVLPLARAHHYTIRAEALCRMGELDSAVVDIAQALMLEPEDIQANRRLLAWGTPAQRAAAAQTLIRIDREAEVLSRALAVLREGGCRAAGAIHMVGGTVEGWAAWNGKRPVKLTIRNGSDARQQVLCGEADAELTAAGFDHVARFRLDRVAGQSHETYSLTINGNPFCVASVLPDTSPAAVKSKPRAKPAVHADITVIVPIYRDYRATRTCLESLARALTTSKRHRVVLVNDASPEPKLRSYVKAFARRRNVTLIDNPVNMGFVQSVNRALAATENGDVILLNADTVVPPDLLRRLAEVARADSSIGTITPLSNNGEFTSFPRAYEANDLPTAKRMAAIDAVAAAVNRGVVIDIPNGIGFCLYITRQCLDAVGALSGEFDRGYLEDVDFCLRVRERGFRNVCATSIYVGHQGSRSFRADKRALVVRNLAILERKFPAYRRECALYMMADPLRPAREAIERAMPPIGVYDRVVVGGSGAVGACIDARVRQLLQAGQSVLQVTVETCAPQRFVIRDTTGLAPQSLTFRVNGSDGYRDLRMYLRSIRFKRIEIADPTRAPPGLVEELLGLGKPLDFFVADAGMPCERAADAGALEWRSVWRSIAKKADCIIVPNARARACVSSVVPSRPLRLASAKVRSRRGHVSKRADHIAILPFGQSAQEFALIQTLLRRLVVERPSATFVVLGKTIDDLALMATGNVFVSGALEADEYEAVIARYRPAKLLLLSRRALFGHPAEAVAERSGLPLAYFDWSSGRVRKHSADLPLDPTLSAEEIAHEVAGWAWEAVGS